MSLDIIALVVFILGLAFWTGVLHNKVCNLKERLDKSDPMVLQVLKSCKMMCGR